MLAEEHLVDIGLIARALQQLLEELQVRVKKYLDDN